MPRVVGSGGSARISAALHLFKRIPLSGVAVGQGAYYFLTGIWPVVHVRSFLAVTGPKTDLWLVYTVGLLLAVVGLAVLTAGWRRKISAEIVLLGVGCAGVLAGVEILFVLKGIISPIYLADAVVEILLIVLWGYRGVTENAA